MTANGRDAAGAAALTVDGAAAVVVGVLAVGVEDGEGVASAVGSTLAESLAVGVVRGSGVVLGDGVDGVALGTGVGLGSGVGSA